MTVDTGGAMRKYRHFLIFLVLAVCSTVAFADLYQWVDENGVVHLSEKPPKDKPAGSKIETIRTNPTQKQPADSHKSRQQQNVPSPVDLRSPAGSIHWYAYHEGMRLSRSTDKPAILILYATWCPTCQKYWRTFDRPSVVEEARRFVMMRVDVDKEPAISLEYNFDGE